MVLDSISDGYFVFKNSHFDKKQIRIKSSDPDAPEKMYFLHIDDLAYKETEIIIVNVDDQLNFIWFF